jgi:lysophospholipase L1-like esterase
MKKPSFLAASLCLATLVGASWQATKPDSVVPTTDEPANQSYNWMARHESVVNRVKQGNVDLLLIGDSITHGWGGPPDGVRGDAIGELWTKYFGSRNAVNEGFGWDRTQHVLWRFDHGELDGISPKVAIVLIGTNNIGSNKTPDVVAGMTAVLDELHQKLPKTKVLLLGIFPRDEKPDASLGKRKGVTYLDLTATFLQPDGAISRDVMGDFLHPTAKGYEMWAKAMEPTLAKLMGDTPRS